MCILWIRCSNTQSTGTTHAHSSSNSSKSSNANPTNYLSTFTCFSFNSFCSHFFISSSSSPVWFGCFIWSVNLFWCCISSPLHISTHSCYSLQPSNSFLYHFTSYSSVPCSCFFQWCLNTPFR